MGTQLSAWITLSLVVMLSGVRLAQRDATVEIAAVREECAGDFVFCFCDTHDEQDTLICEFSSLIVNSTAGTSFSVQPEITEITFNIINKIDEEEVIIPPYFVKEAYVEHLILSCIDESFYLIVNQNAFQSLRSTLIILEIQGCNLNRLSFAFLDGFQNIETIKLHHATFPTGDALETIPKLENWHSFEITHCTGEVEWSSPPSIDSLLHLNLESNRLVDDAVMDILDSVLTFNNMLEVISLRNNSLTEVPEHINSFLSLESFEMSDNLLEHLPHGSLTISSVNVTKIGMNNLSLQKIDPEAFQGYFGRTKISLQHNSLSSFQLMTFKHVLDQMVESIGHLDITGNPIECDCNLVWLIKDHRKLLSRVVGGVCSNSTSFEELDPTGWWSCDVGLLSSFHLDYTIVYEDSFFNSSSASIIEDIDNENATYKEGTQIQSTSQATSHNVEEITTEFEAMLDYLWTSTTTMNDHYIPEDEMLLYYSEQLVASKTEITPKSMFNPETADLETTTEAYNLVQTEPTSSTTKKMPEEENTFYLDTTIDTVDGIEVTTLVPCTEMPADTTEHLTLYSDYDDYLAHNSTTTIYLFEKSGSESRSIAEDGEPSSRPYPIRITTDTPTVTIAFKEVNSDTPAIEVSSITDKTTGSPATQRPSTDSEVKSLLAQNPVAGSLVITFLILLPITLSSLVYICG